MEAAVDSKLNPIVDSSQISAYALAKMAHPPVTLDNEFLDDVSSYMNNCYLSDTSSFGANLVPELTELTSRVIAWSQPLVTQAQLLFAKMEFCEALISGKRSVDFRPVENICTLSMLQSLLVSLFSEIDLVCSLKFEASSDTSFDSPEMAATSYESSKLLSEIDEFWHLQIKGCAGSKNSVPTLTSPEAQSAAQPTESDGTIGNRASSGLSSLSWETNSANGDADTSCTSRDDSQSMSSYAEEDAYGESHTGCLANIQFPPPPLASEELLGSTSTDAGEKTPIGNLDTDMDTSFTIPTDGATFPASAELLPTLERLAEKSSLSTGLSESLETTKKSTESSSIPLALAESIYDEELETKKPNGTVMTASVDSIDSADDSDDGLPCSQANSFSFSARSVEGLKSKLKSRKVSITVETDNGKMFAVGTRAEALASNDITYPSQIIQILKSQRNDRKAKVRLKGGTSKRFIFASASERNRFCRVVEHMLAIHLPKIDLNKISVFVGSWNMGGCLPDYDLTPWLKCCGIGSLSHVPTEPHDVFVIGTQENEISVKVWLSKIRDLLQRFTNTYYEVVEVCSLRAIKLVVLAKPSHMAFISAIHTDKVKTGLGNVVGNKGAVAIRFNFGGTKLCFVNCHLTAHHEDFSRRNQNFFDIVGSLNVSLGDADLRPFCDLQHQCHSLFFLGDLNYRLQQDDINEVLKLISQGDYKQLLLGDQLKILQKVGDVFYNFQEGEIRFPPTYRYEHGSSSDYAWKKVKRLSEVRINVPSWCDRVLWHAYKGFDVDCVGYGCSQDVSCCDHKPVFSFFEIPVLPYLAEPWGKMTNALSTTVIIQLTNVWTEVMIPPNCDASLAIQIMSDCFPEPVRVAQIQTPWPDKDKYHRAEWASEINLVPLARCVNFIAEQYLLVILRHPDQPVSYGSCVLPVLSSVPGELNEFETELISGCKPVGMFGGSMQLTISGSPKHKVHE